MLSTNKLSVRILVVGPTGVGKSALLERICGNTPTGAWTIGCSTHVTSFGYDQAHEFYIEFVDISGVRTYELSRQIYYRNINGLILVYDVSNPRSYENIREWLRELREANANYPIEENYSNTSRSSRKTSRLGDLPMMLIGNKIDLKRPYRFDVKKDFDIQDIAYLTSFRPFHAQPDYKILEQFFRRVIERRHGNVISYRAPMRKKDKFSRSVERTDSNNCCVS